VGLVSRNRIYWGVGAGYVVGFIWSRLDGIRFDASTRGFYWQFLASDHMLGETPRALWYMHIQPAGFNLLLAITDFFYPANQARFFEILYFFLGLAMVLMVTWLVTYWVGNRWVGLVAGLFLVLLPSTYIYGAWLHYTYLIAFLVVAAVFLLAAATAWGRAWLAPMSLLALLGLFLVRSSFAWVFVLFFGAIVVWWSVKIGAKKNLILAVSVIVVAVVGVFTVRSLVLFGQATQSSWGGNMLAAQVWVELAPDQKQAIGEKYPEFRELLEQRTPFSELTPDDIEEAKATLAPSAPLAYSEPFKPNERTNWNFAGFLPLSKQWQAFAFTAIREYPEEYIEGVVAATANYFSNSSCYNWVDVNASEVIWWRQATSPLLLLGGAGNECAGESTNNFVLVPWLFMFTSVVGAFAVSKQAASGVRPTFWFAVLMVLFGAVATNLVAYVEAQRMRMEVDFLLVATGIAGLAIIIQALMRKRVRIG